MRIAVVTEYRGVAGDGNRGFGPPAVRPPRCARSSRCRPIRRSRYTSVTSVRSATARTSRAWPGAVDGVLVAAAKAARPTIAGFSPVRRAAIAAAANEGLRAR